MTATLEQNAERLFRLGRDLTKNSKPHYVVYIDSIVSDHKGVLDGVTYDISHAYGVSKPVSVVSIDSKDFHISVKQENFRYSMEQVRGTVPEDLAERLRRLQKVPDANATGEKPGC